MYRGLERSAQRSRARPSKRLKGRKRGLELKMPYGDRREFVLDNEIVRLLCNCYFVMVFETDSICADSFLRK